MVVKLRVLISLETNTMPCAGGSRQKSRGCAAVKIVNNVVTPPANFPRPARSRHKPAALDGHDVVDMWMMIEQRRDPVFNQNVYLNTRKKALQRHDGRGCKHRVADRAQPDEKNLSNFRPVPAGGRQRLRGVLTLNDVAQAVHRA